MGTVRAAFVGIVVIAAASVLTAASAESVAPIAPYDAFVADATGGLGGNASYSLDPNNATFSLTSGTVGAAFQVTPTADPGHKWIIVMAPPTGSTFAIGTTYSTTDDGDATRAALNITWGGMGCSDTSGGSLTVMEMTRDPGTQEITAFAARFIHACDPGGPPTSAVIRWHSTLGYTAVLADPGLLDFGTVDVGEASLELALTLTSTGSQQYEPRALFLSDPARFHITGDGCTGASLAYGETCQITIVAQPNAAVVQSATLQIIDNTVTGERRIALRVNGMIGANGTYYQLAPKRILDTRSGLGAPASPLGAGEVLRLQVAGRGGVPATGAGAVVLNLTVTGPTATSFLTVWPAGKQRPTASNLNWVRGWTGANSVTVPLGVAGQVDIFNAAGSTAVIADVVGFYAANDDVLASNGLGGQYQLVVPTRLLDTRQTGGAVPPAAAVPIVMDFNTGGQDINSHVRAVAVNITAVGPQAAGFLTAWDGNTGLPSTSTLNFAAGTTVPNLAIVPVGACFLSPSCAGMPQIYVHNGSVGATHVLVDIVGFFDDSGLSAGLRFRPLTPTRIVDTRGGLGIPSALGGGHTGTVSALPVVDNWTFALVTNVTAVNPTLATYLTVWETGTTRPVASNLNPPPGRATPNGAIPSLSAFTQFSIFNFKGTTHVLVDVAGSFELFLVPPPRSVVVSGTVLTGPAVYRVQPAQA